MPHNEGPPQSGPPPGGQGPEFHNYYTSSEGQGPSGRNGLAVAALVTGITGVVLAILPWTFWLGGPLCLVAVGLGIGALRRGVRRGLGNRGMSISGLVLGVIGTIIAAVWLAAAVFLVSEVTACLDQARTPEEVARCGEPSGYQH